MTIIAGTLADKDPHHHNIFMGISLGNKFFDDESNLIRYIQWWLGTARMGFCILLADSIQAHNYVWQRKYSVQKAQETARFESENKRITLERILRKNTPSSVSVPIFSWDSVCLEQENHYDQSLSAICDEYSKGEEFSRDVLDFVTRYIVRLGRNPNELSVLNSVQYILKELPFLTKGFFCNGIQYTCYPYPSVWIGNIVTNIQNGKYPWLRERLNITQFTIQVVL